VRDHGVVTWKKVGWTGLRLAELNTSEAMVDLDKCSHTSYSRNITTDIYQQ
jgi:hypothetical protein